MKTLKWIIVVVKVLVLTGCGGAAKQQAAASDPAEKPLVFHNSEELPAPDSDTLSALEDAVHQQIEKDSANAGFIVSGVGDGEEGHLYPAEDEIWAGMELGAHKGMGGWTDLSADCFAQLKPAPFAAITIGEITVRGKLTTEQIRTTMTQQMERLQSCYERALCRATDISGNQTFGFIVDSQGRVQNVMFENVMFETITIENTNLMNCTYRALHKLNPPQPPATATVSVELIYTVK